MNINDKKLSDVSIPNGSQLPTKSKNQTALPRVFSGLKQEATEAKHRFTAEGSKKLEVLNFKTHHIAASTLRVNKENTPMHILQEEGFRAAQSTYLAQEFLLGKKNLSAEEAQKILDEWILFNSKKLSEDPKIPLRLASKIATLYAEEGKIAESFRVLAQAAQHIRYSDAHPLFDLENAIRDQVIKMENAGLSPDLGAHFSHFDSSSLNEGLLHATNRNINEKNHICLDFKLTPFAKEALERQVKLISNHQKSFLEQIPKDFCQGIKFSEKAFAFLGKAPNQNAFTSQNGYVPDHALNVLEIDFVGLGKVEIGIDSLNYMRWGCLFNQIKIKIETKQDVLPGAYLHQLHQILTLLGCGEALALQRDEDQEKLKLLMFFRSYHPRESYQLEIKKEFYEWSLARVKEEMEALIPGITEKYTKHQMSEIEIYPGQKVWGSSQLADELREKGAWGFMTGRGKAKEKIEDVAQRLISLLKMGSICTQDRFEAGLFVKGASSETDLQTGGGDQVFFRLMTENLKPFQLLGKMQILYDLEAINQGGYTYPSDLYGIKNPKDAEFDTSYPVRKSLLEMTEAIVSPQNDFDYSNNEVMIKRRVSPQLIRAVVVNNEEDKKGVIKVLNQHGIFEFNGKSLENFVQVAVEGNRFKREMWNKI